MKYIIYLIVFLVTIIISCGESGERDKNNLSQEKKKDSIENQLKLKKIAQIKDDSITQIEQNKVIGDITFDLSEESSKKKIEEFILKSKKKKFTNSDLTYPFIGNYEFREFSTKGYYYNDSLFLLKIRGNIIEWEDFDLEVPKQIQFIKDVIELKYGKPDITNSTPEKHRFQKGSTYLVNSWGVGNKKIEIRVEDSGSYYSTDIYIFRPDRVDKARQSSMQNNKIETEKDKDLF